MAADLRGIAPTMEEGGRTGKALNPNPQAPKGELADLRGIAPTVEEGGRSGKDLIKSPPAGQ